MTSGVYTRTEKHKEKISNGLLEAHKKGRYRPKQVSFSPETEFRKGHKTWNKGKHIQTNTGKTHFKKGHIPWSSGLTKETDKRIMKRSERMMGDKNPTKMSGVMEKIILKNKGKHPSEETRKKLKIARAKRILPKKDTTIEVKIQNFLKQLGIEFFTHQYMKIKHGYQCDILIPSMNMVIECDGNYWHKYPVGTEIDHIRTKELLKNGFKVLRLWECEIRTMNLNDFQDKIRRIG